MAEKDTTPRASDDLETSERKSKTIDERVPTLKDADVVPEEVLTGTAAANVPHAGLGREGPLEGGDVGPGEVALDREGRAQRTPIQPG